LKLHDSNLHDEHTGLMSFIRRHTVFVLALMAVVMLGMIFFGDAASKVGGFGQQTTAEVYGKQHGDKELMHLGVNGYALCEQLINLGDQQLWEMFNVLRMPNPDAVIGGIPKPETAESHQINKILTATFFVNRLILREESNRLGIIPSTEQVNKQLQQMFSDKDGNYQPEMYKNFLQHAVTNQGATERDVTELIADKIRFITMYEVLTKGSEFNHDLQKQQVAINLAKSDLQLWKLQAADFVSNQQFEDDKLQAKWQAVQKQIAYILPELQNTQLSGTALDISRLSAYTAAAPYLGAAQRSFNLLLLTPKQAVAYKAEDKQIDVATQELASRLEGLWTELEQNNNADLAKLIKQNNAANPQLPAITLQKFENIAQNTEEELLNVKTNKLTGMHERLIDVAYKLKFNGGSFDRVSDVLVLENGSVVLLQVLEVTPSYVKSFDQVKDALTTELNNEAQKQNMQDAAGKLREALLQAGKDVDGAKLAAEYKADFKEYKDVSEQQLPQDLSNAKQLLEQSRKLALMDVSAPIDGGDGLYLLQVRERSLEQSPIVGLQEQMAAAQGQSFLKRGIYIDWFADKIKQSEAKVLIDFR